MRTIEEDCNFKGRMFSQMQISNIYKMPFELQVNLIIKIGQKREGIKKVQQNQGPGTARQNRRGCQLNIESSKGKTANKLFYIERHDYKMQRKLTSRHRTSSSIISRVNTDF